MKRHILIYLWAEREAGKEEAMEPSHSKAADNTT